MSFHGGRILARDPNLGQVIAVPADAAASLDHPQALPAARRSTLGETAHPKGIPSNVRCTPHMSMNLWVDSPGTLEMTFEGGRSRRSTSGRARARGRSRPTKRTTIRIPINAAASSLAFATDWNRSAGAPRLVEAVLRHRARTASHCI